MRRKEVRLRKKQVAQRYRRTMDRAREEPRLLFIERAPLQVPVVTELDRDRGQTRPAGFWREAVFYRVERIVDVRREYDAVYYRVITDRGCFDLRRYRQLAPWTLRPSVGWELTAELEAIEVKRPF